jgi:hypothetical protein
LERAHKSVECQIITPREQPETKSKETQSSQTTTSKTAETQSQVLSPPHHVESQQQKTLLVKDTSSVEDHMQIPALIFTLNQNIAQLQYLLSTSPDIISVEEFFLVQQLIMVCVFGGNHPTLSGKAKFTSDIFAKIYTGSEKEKLNDKVTFAQLKSILDRLQHSQKFKSDF